MAKRRTYPQALIEAARRDYVPGGGSLRAIARRYHLPEKTLISRAGRGGWTEELRRNQAAVCGREQTMPARLRNPEAILTERVAGFLDSATRVGGGLVEDLDGLRVGVQTPGEFWDLAGAFGELVRSGTRLYGLDQPAAGLSITVGVLGAAFGTGDLALDEQVPAREGERADAPD